jgi:hypothetical protein
VKRLKLILVIGFAAVAGPMALWGGYRTFDVQQANAERKLPSRSKRVSVPIDFERTSIRVRVVSLEPNLPSVIRWRYGGEGLGGEPKKGVFQSSDPGPLAVGQWSDPVPLKDIFPVRGAEDAFLTLTAGSKGKLKRTPHRHWEGYSRNVLFEIEQLNAGSTVKRLREIAPDGGTITLLVPGAEGKGFVNELATVKQVAEVRRDMLRALPWAKRSGPSRHAVVSDLGGYGTAMGYGIKTTDPELPRIELDSLLELGVNGLRTVPPSFVEQWPDTMLPPASFASRATRSHCRMPLWAGRGKALAGTHREVVARGPLHQRGRGVGTDERRNWGRHRPCG